jgi:hypothetical protein
LAAVVLALVTERVLAQMDQTLSLTRSPLLVAVALVGTLGPLTIQMRVGRVVPVVAVEVPQVLERQGRATMAAQLSLLLQVAVAATEAPGQMPPPTQAVPVGLG